MNIEKILQNYLRGKIQTVDKQTILDASFGDGNKTLNVFFALAREEIRNTNDNTNLDRLSEMLSWMETILVNKVEINHKIVERKVNQLLKLMDTVLEEKNKTIRNPEKVNSEFDKVRRALEGVIKHNHADTKSYIMMDKLINDIRNLTYLDCILKGVPCMANVKNNNGIPIIQTTLSTFLSSAEKNQKEEVSYYEKVIILILAQEGFEFTETLKKKCLDMINHTLQNIRANKKRSKKMKDVINILISMQERIKNHGTEEKSIDLLADKYKIHVFFNEPLLEKAKLTYDSKEGVMSDREIVSDYMVSIDKAGAIEIDDALSCKRLPNGHYLLGFHQASVLGYFPYESDIVQEAIFRNHAVYLPTNYQKKNNDYRRTIPILPYSFSAEKGSLKENEPRRARSHFFEIDEDGNIINERIFVKTVVTNRKKLSYNEADKVLTEGSKDRRLRRLMRDLQAVTKILSRKYREDYLYESIKENTEDASLLRTKRIGSENIVFRASLLTGNRVGEFFARNGYPCLYRVHEVDKRQQQELKNLLEEIKKIYGDDRVKKIYQILESLYPKARYALSGRHDGLNVDHMVQCTSELRRGGDIVVEHAAEVCIDKTPTEEELRELEEELALKAEQLNSQVPYMDIFVKEYQRQNSRRSK